MEKYVLLNSLIPLVYTRIRTGGISLQVKQGTPYSVDELCRLCKKEIDPRVVINLDPFSVLIHKATTRTPPLSVATLSLRNRSSN